MPTNTWPLSVDLMRLCESLESLAWDISVIANGEADDEQAVGWSNRKDGGAVLVRLNALLDQLFITGSDAATLRVLRDVCKVLDSLSYGGGQANYRGPLFLPGELDEAGTFNPQSRFPGGWPILAEHLREYAAALRGGNRGESSPAHSFPSYSVDSKLKQVRYGGNAYDLTSEQCRLLELLQTDSGEWVPLSKHDFTKPSTLRKNLPKPIQDLIEYRSKGYRLRRLPEARNSRRVLS